MRLKRTADPSDVMAMFSATKQPPALSEASLVSLCASLNAPIVHVDELPAGPARCAVVVFAEPYGDLGVTVAVRSLEGGEVLVLRSREPLPPDAAPAAALEMAIHHAEGLGFVFDDDMLAGGQVGQAERLSAFQHWLKVVGSDEVYATPDVASPPSPAGSMNSPEPERMPEMEDLLSASASQRGSDGEEPVEIELDELSIGDLGPDDLEAVELDADGGELLLEEIAPLDSQATIEVSALDDLDDADDLEAGLSVDLEAVAPAEAPEKPAAAAMAEATEPTQLDPAQSEHGGKQAGRAFAASPLSKFRRPAEGAASAEQDEASGEAAASVKQREARAEAPPRVKQREARAQAAASAKQDEALAATGVTPAAAEDVDGATGAGSALGRVKIVRMKKSRDGRASARGRILASY